MEMLDKQLLPALNLFGYGQVESYGTSGDFYDALQKRFDDERRRAVAHPGPRRHRRLDQDLLGRRKLDEAEVPYRRSWPEAQEKIEAVSPASSG